jgi:hypothetical protein
MNECDAAFKQEIVVSCCDALERCGFTRYRKLNVDWPPADGFHCWVGLNTGLYRDHVDINPFSGVHVIPFEKIVGRLKRGKYTGKYDRHVATYATHLGTLAPKECAFRFTRDTIVREDAERLAMLYLNAAIPFAKSNSNYETLLPHLRSRVRSPGAYPERVAICLYLMGRTSEALSFTREFLVDQNDYFEDFALSFIEMVGSKG